MNYKSEMLASVLTSLEDLETEINSKLEKLVKEKARREYRNDILQLSTTDIALLTTYYVNSNEAVRRQFLSLLQTTYNDNAMVENFMVEFKNLYFLNKAGLNSTIQYGAAKRVVIDFINKLKDECLTDKKIDKDLENELRYQLSSLKQLISYFFTKAGSVEIKNIDDFLMILNMFKISDEIKNNALSIAISNNVKFYKSAIRRNKKIDKVTEFEY